MLDTDARSSLGCCCVVVCLVFWAASSSGAENRGGWLHFEPAVVELTGVLGVAYEYGPPSWVDDSKSDDESATPILRLSRPINILEIGRAHV